MVDALSVESTNSCAVIDAASDTVKAVLVASGVAVPYQTRLVAASSVVQET